MITDLFRVDGRAAIVTGAGRGIGAASAIALAQAGADVVISARTEAQLGDVASTIQSLGRRVAIVPADLEDLEAVARLADVCKESFGRIDILVNNVGGAMPRGFLETSPGFMERAFHFNVATAHALTRASVPTMLSGDGGAVVNISSAMGRLVGRGYVGYGTAKGALTHYTRLAATDLAPRIRVNGIAVGAVATSALDIIVSDEGLRTAMENMTPLRRIGTTDDIAACVLYLSSPAGSYLTGKMIEVDGGIEQPNADLGMPDL